MALKYYAGTEFGKLDEQSQRTRKSVIEACLREPKKASPGTYALTKQHMQVLRDRKKDLPGAAVNRIKYLSAMFSWATEHNLMGFNPALGVKKLGGASAGFRTWSLPEVKQFETFYPIGSRQRLALALLLYTGVRRSDLLFLGTPNMSGGMISYIPKKTRYKKLDMVTIPVLPPLAEVLKATPLGRRTFLETGHGVPFTPAGFGRRFREWCDAAGLEGLGAHVLRKLAATLMAEPGGTVHELMSAFGWSWPQQALVCTRAANAKRLANAGMAKMLQGMNAA